MHILEESVLSILRDYTLWVTTDFLPCLIPIIPRLMKHFSRYYHPMFDPDLLSSFFISLTVLDLPLMPPILVTVTFRDKIKSICITFKTLLRLWLKGLYRWDFHHYLTLLISQENKQKPRGRYGLLTLDMLKIRSML